MEGHVHCLILLSVFCGIIDTKFICSILNVYSMLLWSCDRMGKWVILSALNSVSLTMMIFIIFLLPFSFRSYFYASL